MRISIRTAYVFFANGVNHMRDAADTPVEGGPAWIQSDAYQITLKTESPENMETMQGIVLQDLLEERFKLKIHRATRETPVYALTVAKGGPKLEPFKELDCVPTSFANPHPPLAPNQKYCPPGVSTNGGIVTIDMRGGLSLDDFLGAIAPDLDRPIINRTGITGLFQFHLVYAPDERAARFERDGADGAPGAAEPSAGPSIFNAVQQQLGWKLTPAKGPGALLVVDHVEKPSEN